MDRHIQPQPVQKKQETELIGSVERLIQNAKKRAVKPQRKRTFPGSKSKGLSK